MTGLQKTIVDALYTLARWVEEGRYGTNDDINADALDDDITEEVFDKLD